MPGVGAEIVAGHERIVGGKWRIKHHPEQCGRRHCNLIKEKVFGFDGIIQQIVNVFCLQLIVLEQLMIRSGREKKRRKKQGINNIRIIKASINEGIANVFQIMIEDIVTANIFRPIVQFRYR